MKALTDIFKEKEDFRLARKIVQEFEKCWDYFEPFDSKDYNPELMLERKRRKEITLRLVEAGYLTMSSVSVDIDNDKENDSRVKNVTRYKVEISPEYRKQSMQQSMQAGQDNQDRFVDLEKIFYSEDNLRLAESVMTFMLNSSFTQQGFGVPILYMHKCLGIDSEEKQAVVSMLLKKGYLSSEPYSSSGALESNRIFLSKLYKDSLRLK